MMLRSEYEIATTSGASFGAVNPHFLDSIVRVSDAFEVRAANDIVDDSGTTLWRGGARISRDLAEKLDNRRLRRPLEATIEIKDGLSMDGVVADCLELVAKNRILEVLAGRKGVLDLLRGMRTIAATQPLRVLATAAREQRRRDYDSSLAAAIVAAGLANRAGFGINDSVSMTLAALVSDVGEMYIDPGHLDNARELRPHEWKHVVWHPYVGESFLNEFTQLPATVNNAVLQHHERFDGHGYPFGVTGERLRMPFMMVGVADTVAAIIMRGGLDVPDRISAALRILPGEFPPPAVVLVTSMLAGTTPEPLPAKDGGASECIEPCLERIRAAMREAIGLAHGEHSITIISVADQALDFLDRIDMGLQAIGAEYRSPHQAREENRGATAGNPGVISDEISWRLRNLARNLHLDAEQSGDSQDLATLAGLFALLDRITDAADQEPVSR